MRKELSPIEMHMIFGGPTIAGPQYENIGQRTACRGKQKKKKIKRIRPGQKVHKSRHGTVVLKRRGT